MDGVRLLALTLTLRGKFDLLSECVPGYKRAGSRAYLCTVDSPRFNATFSAVAGPRLDGLVISARPP